MIDNICLILEFLVPFFFVCFVSVFLLFPFAVKLPEFFLVSFLASFFAWFIIFPFTSEFDDIVNGVIDNSKKEEIECYLEEGKIYCGTDDYIINEINVVG